ncbi:hypothetical protein ABIF38_005682 [Bradyrhizobium japonicum]|uniref:hypothetical protein n=1 Tax=Bradyrhizobium elkanii TaxID=29448 RepID=UPI00036C4689|nr:hypothetical protein [Bradyrhizobium elkanii]MBP2434756.1 hypothetical protein [Bradyrhizobium elkanii]MCP1732008.1 hypothetical protein [Bradyrhizobium elkanii]MCS3567342.1 hypothetical protein [Bradyrhizobium elkanii]MCS3591173.1 hypothetical protein [Bradyrhizobium elkanii]MCS3620616.1 hypothetical protein [Bradyrhizobium elkanii]
MTYTFEVLPLAVRDDRRVVPDFDAVCSALSETAAMRIAGKIVAEGAAIGVVGANVYRCPCDDEPRPRYHSERIAYIGKRLVWSGYHRSWVVEDEKL